MSASVRAASARARFRPPTGPCLLLVALALTGCFSQKSFPLAPGEFTTAPRAEATTPTARAWLTHTHRALRGLLPTNGPRPLLTEDLVDADGSGKRAPIDVLKLFGRSPESLPSIWGNYSGILHTAQCSGADSDGAPAPPWPGFEDVWVPVGQGRSLGARIGFATDGARPRQANCVIVLPGLFGDNQVWRTRDICLALREHGLHAVALETRGFGQTGARYPDIYYTFGVLETYDLLEVAAWLVDRPEVLEVGVVGFCWGANQALLAAWAASRLPDDPDIPERLRAYLPAAPRAPGTLLRAGAIAFSPVLRFEEIVADCDRPWGLLENPVLNHLQAGVELRMRQKQHREVSGSLGDLIRFEFERSELHYPEAPTDGYDFLRFLPYRNRAAGPGFERVAAPTLIVQAANDPLTSAQNVADLMAGIDNPQVAALILAGGGHVGFAAYAKRYFYSLLINFFCRNPGGAVFADTEPRP